MNHQKVYESIIQRAKSENRIKLNRNNENYIYYENHHILPKCLGGNNDKDNLVLLTAKEHYVCHKLLTYIYKENAKIYGAFFYMSFNKKYDKFLSARDYAYAIELNTIAHINKKQSLETKEKRRKSMLGKNKGKKMKKEFGENISKRLKGNIPWNKGKPGCFSNDTINKMSIAAIGVKNSLESNEKNRQSHIGKTTWNKGLTKEIDERVLKCSLKISKTLKNKNLLN